MAIITCPFCRHRNESSPECSKCGTNFESYELRKQEQIAHVCNLLDENRFVEAKDIAQNLPAEFPDNRSDFLLLLSNISRDISIVEKCDQAQKALAEFDYGRVTLLLRNIKAFDKNLNERVISLRRKAEQHTENITAMQQAVNLFNKGSYGEAQKLFLQFKGSESQVNAADYLKRIEEIQRNILAEAIVMLKQNRFDIAACKFALLQKEFPDENPELEAYLTLIARKNDLKHTILQAAGKAEREKRYIEAKIAYTLLGIQFPECLHLIRQKFLDMGIDTPLSLAELHAQQKIDLNALGFTENDSAVTESAVPGIEIFRSLPDIAPADLTGDAISDLGPVEASQQGAPDTAGRLLDIAVAQVADFIF